MIIDSGTEQPDKVVDLLRQVMRLKAGETLCLNTIQKFFDEQGVSTDDAQLLRLYLEDNNLLD